MSNRKRIVNVILIFELASTIIISGCSRAQKDALEVYQQYMHNCKTEDLVRAASLITDHAKMIEVKKYGDCMTDVIKTVDGLRYKDIIVGKGAIAQSGDTVRTNYTGWLINGTKFDSSIDHGGTFEFALGQGLVIKGWEEGVPGMKVGGTRILIIPPDLGYGAEGAGGVIPGNATMIFQVQLLAIK